jgi:hypothetical protein
MNKAAHSRESLYIRQDSLLTVGLSRRSALARSLSPERQRRTE